MTNAVTAISPGLWGPGSEKLSTAAGVADQAIQSAGAHAADLTDLARGSPAVMLLLGVGLALWLVGDRLFRPAASLVGATAGALAGLSLSTSFQGEVLGLPAPYAAIGIGAVLGLAIGAAMYRFAVGAASAVTLAGVAGAIAAAVLLHQPAAAPAERPETIAEARGLESSIATVAFEVGDESDSGVGFTREDLEAAAASAGAIAQREWASLPAEARNMILAASILGCVLGFAVGVIRPRTAGPAIAALAGAALWIGATTVLLATTGRAIPPLPSAQPGAWLAGWLLVALLGFAIQRRVIRPGSLVEARESD